MSKFERIFSQIDALEVAVSKMESDSSRDLLLEISELRYQLTQIQSGRLTREEILKLMLAIAEWIHIMLIALGG